MRPHSPVRWLLRIPVLLKVVMVVGFAVALYLAVTFVQVWQASRADGARPAEAVVVLGAAQYDGEPSPVLRARLDHAADLYHRELAPTVVVTGGKREGDRFSEAAAGARYLHGKGIPDQDILRETSGRSSWESLAASARFLDDRGIRDVVLVSDPFHAERVDAIADEVGLDASVSPAPGSPIRGGEEWRRMASETVRVAVGRIFGFRRLVNLSGAEG